MSLVKQALIIEFKELAANAIDYKSKIETAKTFTKKEIYKKKLKKNNIKAAEILSALERLMTAEESKSAGAKNETLSIEGRA